MVPHASPSAFPPDREGRRTAVGVRVREPLHLLLGLVEERGDGARVADVAVAFKHDADLDRAVAPEVAADVPAGRGRARALADQSKQGGSARRAQRAGRGRGVPVLGSLECSPVQVLQSQSLRQSRAR